MFPVDRQPSIASFRSQELMGDDRDELRNHIGQKILDPHLDDNFDSRLNHHKSEDVKSENNGDDIDRPIKQCPLCNKKIKSGGNHSTAQEAVGLFPHLINFIVPEAPRA